MTKQATGVLATLGTLFALSAAAFAQDGEPIKMGVLEDQSGDFAVATIGKVHGIELAAEEINANGGIDGRAALAQNVNRGLRRQWMRRCCGSVRGHEGAPAGKVLTWPDSVTFEFVDINRNLRVLCVGTGDRQ